MTKGYPYNFVLAFVLLLLLRRSLEFNQLEAPFGPETRGKENREEVSLPFRFNGLEKSCEFYQRGPRQSPS